MNQQTIIPPAGAALGAWAYGSVTARFLAMLIDFAFVFVLMLIVFVPLFLISLFASFIVSPLLALLGLTLIPSFAFLFVCAHGIYYATMESSERGATYGKRLAGLRVVGESGGRLSFARASLRYVAKLLSAAPFMLGFFMALVTARKQALHDLISETIVIRG